MRRVFGEDLSVCKFSTVSKAKVNVPNGQWSDEGSDVRAKFGVADGQWSDEGGDVWCRWT
ncbi:unnamed protein product [Clonostachys rhizophaga]|uniref:Uncharacterized protein n=1 Tax=Clonostachys rhizophaga TaxID=160324 RepID=A0A9N9VXC9_9HYPO|nr:unnamed protein product [Clonostachys rhizophaga]